jgi:KEOPS complex subunit Cgi121
LIEEVDHYYLLSQGHRGKMLQEPETILRQLRSASEDVHVQLVKPSLVAGPEHLRIAAANALQSFRGRKPRSKSLAVELLLYISCQRQISKAIKLLGVESSDDKVVLVALSGSKDSLSELEKNSTSILGEADDSLVEIGSKPKLAEIQRSYGVSDREIEAARFDGENVTDCLKRLIVERSALLLVQD